MSIEQAFMADIRVKDERISITSYPDSGKKSLLQNLRKIDIHGNGSFIKSFGNGKRLFDSLRLSRNTI